MEKFTIKLDSGQKVTGRHCLPNTDRSSSGQTARPLIVCVHGASYDSEYFDANADYSWSVLANAFNVPIVAIDRPDYGGSTEVPNQNDPGNADTTTPTQRQARYLESTVLPRIWNEFGLTSGASSMVIVGHSVGGMVGIETAAAHATQTTSLYPLSGLVISGIGCVQRKVESDKQSPNHDNGEKKAQEPVLPAKKTRYITFEITRKNSTMLDFTADKSPAGLLISPDILQVTEQLNRPAPLAELIDVAQLWRSYWRREAEQVNVPVFYALTEVDPWFDSSNKSVSEFAGGFTSSPKVMHGCVPRAPHCIELSLQAKGWMLQCGGFALETLFVNLLDILLVHLTSFLYRADRATVAVHLHHFPNQQHQQGSWPVCSEGKCCPLATMPDDSKSKTFPDLSSKLSAPPKRSLFERQKAEAEAKRAREKAETAAVYEDFVKSFDDDGDSSSRRTLSNFRSSGPGSLGGPPPKRHFTGASTSRNSGPGSLGPPPPSLARKRTYDGFFRDRDRNNRESGSHGIFGYDDNSPQAAFRTSDDEAERDVEDKEAERAVAKPTVYLSSLPPGSSPAVIKALIPGNLTVDAVKIIPPPAQPSMERRSFSAIVTLAQDTAASDIDAAVSALQSKYLGWGYYLSISRHLSSAAIQSGMPVTVGSSSKGSLPFGAKPVNQAPVGRLNRAPPPGPHRGGFAPPASYGSQYGKPTSTAEIEVKPPSNLKQLRLIHKTLENLLKYGPEFEALLMSRLEVQREEKWAWIWDARSVGGIWYRWKLWDVLTNAKTSRGRYGRNSPATLIFEGGASWLGPESPIRFEYATTLDEFVSDEDYDSSDEEGSDNEESRRRHAADDAIGGQDGMGYMDPLQKAKLTHLLARLPTANTKLRRGDVARVTAFAIEHASAGAEEVVEMLVANVLRPFAYSRANPDREEVRTALRESEANTATGDKTDAGPGASGKGIEDTSAAKLVGLYVISDIFSSSSTSGVRHAWRYRQLFEHAFRTHKVFEHLGRLEKELKWGRLKAEKWKRSVGAILHIWEGWSVFPQPAQDHFIQMFENPPLTKNEMEEEKKKAEAEQAQSAAGNKGKGRWKTVDEDAGKFILAEVPAPEQSAAPQFDDSLDGEPMSDIDGVPMEDSDLEGDDLDGQPLDMAVDMQDNEEKREQPDQATESTSKPEENTPVARVRKPRPKAEDMFADSDDDDV
ncbi:conserved hypothetical protein [Talaromyces stipitatus ATCC 10500]|uniref:CID domain-containing protein n=1 Tax=Talaromyces stipitatus (strain ATCC 10500 / CBS 375.48 / QM 6759 / NRRL 1006) TaxID=441959 RepID=B8M4I3_TALSN|nr:uncharacterized protein TSTA_025000 [Talaromyces stipitatus ATCC 10500]EED19178.1 conserved hypothetical protein [Talaromyces stipitatus ATCC 10500]